ncbi:MAG TPA: hemolysin family protein [Planctomycetia bacterium]|nr:hemolysin family protein [Planctomycetia bacterium]
MLLQAFFIVILLLVANGFFAAAEIAIVAARKGRLQQEAEAGDKASKIALGLANEPGKFLPTVQLGITVVGTLAAAYGESSIGHALAEMMRKSGVDWLAKGAQAWSLTAVVVIISFLEILIGELVPKRLALRNPAKLARFVAYPMQALAIAGRPIVIFMDKASNLVLRMLGVRPGETVQLNVEDIEHMIEEGASGGILAPVERQVAMEALRLGDRMVRDVMQPRIEIDGLATDTPPAEILGTVSMAGFSRLPVYEGDLDHIIGFVHVKDVLRQVHLGWKLDLRKLLRPALFVPKTLPLDKLLVQFREARTHLAVVLDEFGGTEGIVTLDSVLEELIGEIHDEHSRDTAQEIVRRADGSWLVDGVVNLDDLFERIGYRNAKPPSPRDYSTLAGLIFDLLGRLPEVAETLEWEDLALEVVDMDGPRIDRVLVKFKDGTANAAEAE